jgi:hypothetical protein
LRLCVTLCAAACRGISGELEQFSADGIAIERQEV